MPGWLAIAAMVNRVFVQQKQTGWWPLEAFKARLDVALGSLVCWLATLHIARGLKLDDLCNAFQPRPFYDSMKRG